MRGLHPGSLPDTRRTPRDLIEALKSQRGCPAECGCVMPAKITATLASVLVAPHLLAAAASAAGVPDLPELWDRSVLGVILAGVIFLVGRGLVAEQRLTRRAVERQSLLLLGVMGNLDDHAALLAGVDLADPSTDRDRRLARYWRSAAQQREHLGQLVVPDQGAPP